jgi:hypothetical protein
MKLVVAIILAGLLVPFGGQPAAAPAPVAAPAATAAPFSAASTAVPVATAAQANAPVVAAPQILSTREAVFAGPYTVRGTGTPGSTVEVLVDGQPVGTATVGADGRWSFNTTLAEGQRAIVARAVDASGAVLAAAEPIQLNVGAAPAVAPTAAATAAATSVAVPPIAVVVEAPQILPTREAIVAGPYTVRGTGTAGSTVEMLVDGQPVGTATVGSDGRWSFNTTLAEGQRAVAARAVDASGAVLAEADPIQLSVGAAPPPAQVRGGEIMIATPAEGAAISAGRVTISGIGPAGATLEVLNGDKVLAETTVESNGAWSVEIELEDGTAAIGVREKGETDLAGRPVRVAIGDSQTATCTAVAVGCPAWVTRAGGQVLRMRDGPSLSGVILTRLPIGTQMEVLEGPRPADGFTWWRVRSTGGREGWVAGENLVLQPD